MAKFVEVAFPIPSPLIFTYELPADVGEARPGVRVLVPFGGRTLTGFVVNTPETSPEGVVVKQAHAILDDVPLLTVELLNLAKVMADQHVVCIGEVIQTILPPGLIRASRRVVTILDGHNKTVDPGSNPELEGLQIGKTYDLIHLLKRKPKLAGILRKLEKSGLARMHTVLRQERARAKTDYRFVLTPAKGEDCVRGRKQQQAFEFIRACDDQQILASQVRKQRPDLLAALRALVGRGFIAGHMEEVLSGTAVDPYFEVAPAVKLNADQVIAVDAVHEALQTGSHHVILLHGATGSGKTEVYLRSAQQTLALGRHVLALVPEISLTPQFVGRFRARFGDRVALLHSGLSDSQRLGEWRRIRLGQVQIVIGARSAVFSPLENIGLVIVDEEHDASYKQEDGVLYHAKYLAKLRAQHHQAVFLLGSATPAIETYHQSEVGEVVRLSLPKRVNCQALPDVAIVDLRHEVTRFGEKGVISKLLRDQLEQTVSRGHQAVLFLNRRGYAPLVLCPTCGDAINCQLCSVTLTYHEAKNSLECHYCGYRSEWTACCPTCQGKLIRLGTGTESVAQELAYYFPDIRIGRMDRDTMTTKDAHQNILKQLGSGEIDILIGTQMISKGIDVENVNLVGVLLADQSLHYPDFRAAEFTFQLLTQVVGRSGRGQTKGQAILQTFQPEHFAIVLASQQNYEAFYNLEIEARRRLNYPPFSHLTLFRLQGCDDSIVRDASQWLAKQAVKGCQMQKLAIELLGPAPAPIRKIRNAYRHQFILRSSQAQLVLGYSRWLLSQGKDSLLKQGVGVSLDLYPMRFL